MVIVVAVAFIVSWSPFYLSTLVSQIQTISGKLCHLVQYDVITKKINKTR